MENSYEMKMKTAVVYFPTEEKAEIFTPSMFAALDDLAGIASLGTIFSPRDDDNSAREMAKRTLDKLIENVNKHASKKTDITIADISLADLSEGLYTKGAFHFFPEEGDIQMNDEREEESKEDNPIVVGATIIYFMMVVDASQFTLPVEKESLDSEIDIFLDRIEKRFTVRKQGEE